MSPGAAHQTAGEPGDVASFGILGAESAACGAFLRCSSESNPLKNRSLAAQVFSGLLLAVVTLALTACGQNIYINPQNIFAGRALPPSGLLQRVMASFTANGSQGGLEILDGLRDIRSNVQNTIPAFTISGYSGGNPTTILNFPEQEAGYVFSSTDGSLTGINYAKETAAGTVAGFSPSSPSVAAATDGSRFFGAQLQAGQLAIAGAGGNFFLNLPNVNKVVVNRGNTVVLAMVRNSNSLYRVIKINSSPNPVVPPGSVDCQPQLLPVFCVVPVPGTYDRPQDAYFSLDGNTVYVLNCGPECGGVASSVTALQVGALTVDLIPSVNPLSAGAPSPLAILPVANPIPIPGGVTAALSDGVTLYLSGQSLFNKNAAGALVPTPRADGLFTGYLTTVNLANYVVSNPYSISDGLHTKMLFADDSTLWIGSQQCANGERAATLQNYNCLTRVVLGGATLAPQIVPSVTPSGTTTVPYPNGDQNPYYYGSLTGLCWVQEYHKVYTAYGGQIHAFRTADGSEIDNTNIKIQGTVLDVAYIDALSNNAN